MMASAVTGEGRVIGILRRRLCGDVLAPGESGFEAARTLWNARIDRTPVAIVRATDADDVATAVRVAREQARPVRVKAGGHPVWGRALADGAIAIDLSPINGVHVEASTRRVTAGAGARWREVDAATELHGLAVAGGQDPNIGAAAQG
jgi:FAD/FMN-containing dehydrogenase